LAEKETMPESSADMDFFGGVACQLELGPRWSVASLERLLRMAPGRDAGQRLVHIANEFLYSPFFFESNLPIPQKGIVRVRLEDFDCVTFIYYMLALCQSLSFDDFVRNLVLLRYRNDSNPTNFIVDSDPSEGNIFDFVCESLLINAVQRGWLRNVTMEVAGAVPTTMVEVFLAPIERPGQYDRARRLVTPKFGARLVSQRMIPAAQIQQIDAQKVRPGDIFLMSRGPTQPDGSPASVLIGHLVIAVEESACGLSFLHATRHFAVRPQARAEGAGSFTGIFYDEDHHYEQLGVSFGRRFADLEIWVDGDRITGLLPDAPRSIQDYVMNVFQFAMVLRPTFPRGPLSEHEK
jgi:hypothetical protein